MVRGQGFKRQYMAHLDRDKREPGRLCGLEGLSRRDREVMAAVSGQRMLDRYLP